MYHFSFAKTHQQLKATTQALFGSDGHIVPFGEFEEIAQRINNEFNVRHLRTEYDTAIGSAQMASRWVQYQSEKKQFPNLTYRTVGDSNVRPSHQLLDRVTRPIDDDFWDVYYTPNGWGCRCDVEQSTGKWVTDMSKVVMPTDVPAMFKTNLAKNGLVYPAGHPYYEDLPKSVLEAADNNNPFLYEKIHTGKNGGYVYDNRLHNKVSDWDDELHTVKLLADKGEKVILLPEIAPDNVHQERLRKLVLPKSLHTTRKTPDCKVGNDLVELKTCKANTTGAIDNLIRRGAKQADIVCIRLTGDMKLKQLKKAVKGRVLRSDNLKGVWLIQNDKLVKYSRAQIEKF